MKELLYPSTERAAEWLTSYVVRPTDREEVMRAGREAGHSAAALIRAKARLGMRHRRTTTPGLRGVRGSMWLPGARSLARPVVAHPPARRRRGSGGVTRHYGQRWCVRFSFNGKRTTISCASKSEAAGIGDRVFVLVRAGMDPDDAIELARYDERKDTEWLLEAKRRLARARKELRTERPDA